MVDENEFILFKQTREMELKIADFLSNILHGGFLYATGMEKYFESGAGSGFDDVLTQLSDYEAQNDELRRTVEISLYVQMILPDVRADIQRILEGCDQIINTYENNLLNIMAERPKIPAEYIEMILEMIKPSLTCVGTLISAVRCFFSGRRVDEDTKKVSFFEHEIDVQSLKIKRKIFSDKKLTLARQMQLRDVINDIESISNIAEDVADRLAVMSVKHSL